MNHSIEDRVKVDCPVSRQHGKEAVVLSGLVPGVHYGYPYMGYTVDLPQTEQSDKFCIFEAHELIPIDDKYDGMELTTWSECPFKPLEFVT